MADKTTIKLSGKTSLSEKPELPIDGLPASVREYIETVCDIYHCPREFVATAVLATAATAVGKKIKVNEGKYMNSLVLWFVSVARSGSNKSYPMKLVTEPLRKIDGELYASYKKQHDEWKSVPIKDRSGDEPKCPAIVLDDCTDERRSEILFMNNDTCYDGTPTASSGTKRGAIGIYPELKGMFDAKNQYQNCGTVGISKLLRLFDCENIKVDRKGSFTMLIQDPFCNILGDLQTSMLKPTFGSEIFMSNGLNQRFLFCVAEDIEYPERSHATLPSGISLQWAQTVKTLYDGIYHDIMNKDKHHTLFRSNDGIVSLGDDADSLYNDYYNRLQLKKASAATDYEGAIYSKLQIQCLRYAGIVHALEVAEEKGMRDDYNIMHGNTMEYAIRCMDYFEKMALLVYKKITEPYPTNVQTGMTKADVIRIFLGNYPNVSQNSLASLIGCSAAYISKIMNQK